MSFKKLSLAAIFVLNILTTHAGFAAQTHQEIPAEYIKVQKDMLNSFGLDPYVAIQKITNDNHIATGHIMALATLNGDRLENRVTRFIKSDDEGFYFTAPSHFEMVKQFTQHPQVAAVVAFKVGDGIIYQIRVSGKATLAPHQDEVSGKMQTVLERDGKKSSRQNGYSSTYRIDAQKVHISLIKKMNPKETLFVQRTYKKTQSGGWEYLDERAITTTTSIEPNTAI